MVYETEKRGDGSYQWRRTNGRWNWRIAKDVGEMLAAIDGDATADYEVRYMGKTVFRSVRPQANP